MRILKFIVDSQIIKQDPNCDFDGLVPGTKGYLVAEFSFSPEWKDCVKVATFCSAMGREFPPQILKQGVRCLIPEEALEKRIFKVGVVGKSNSGLRLTTNKVEVIQNGGKA